MSQKNVDYVCDCGGGLPSSSNLWESFVNHQKFCPREQLISEDQWDGLEFQHDVKFNPNAKILQVEDFDDTAKFAEKYCSEWSQFSWKVLLEDGIDGVWLNSYCREWDRGITEAEFKGCLFFETWDIPSMVLLNDSYFSFS